MRTIRHPLRVLQRQKETADRLRFGEICHLESGDQSGPPPPKTFIHLKRIDRDILKEKGKEDVSSRISQDHEASSVQSVLAPLPAWVPRVVELGPWLVRPVPPASADIQPHPLLRQDEGLH